MSELNQEISQEKSQTVLSPTKSVKLRISRSNPEVNSEERFDEFVIPVEKYTTVLDAILNVKSHLDHSVAVRYSCSCLLYTSPSPRDGLLSRMPSSA